MFEVEPILWLQGFASPALTAMMQLVSLLGREWFYALVVLVVGFGLRLRPMLGVLLALLLAGLCTHAIKRELGLPRPVQVDARVLHKGGANTRWLVRHGGAADAFALPTPAAIAAARAVPQPDFGFISGHAAAATAFCASLLLAFPGLRRRPVVVAALVAWPLLMMVSRMYLGRHFPGDVLAGALAGLLAATAAFGAWRRAPAIRRWLPPIAACACVASWWWPAIDPATAGRLFGLALLAAAFTTRDAWPVEAGSTPRQQAGRVVLAFCVYALARVGASALLQDAGWEGVAAPVSLVAFGATGCVLGGSTWLAKRLRLYPVPSA